MIISKTPCRISFVGGGSDIPAFYERHGGAVISTTINKYVYITINPKFDRRIRLSYSKTEEVDTVDEINHPLLREALRTVGVTGGVEITSIADIPSQGTGLGSSSAFTVGLLNSLFAYQGRRAPAPVLARLACDVEIERCGEPIGKQDQYAAAFGGFNLTKFAPDGAVVVDPIVCSRRTLHQLQHNLLMFYTGVTRSAKSILTNQIAAINESENVALVRSMVDLAWQMQRELQNDNLDCFGEILHESWQLKRRITAGISTNSIDYWYLLARKAGAIGGKILGAGGGGFLLFFAPERCHAAIEEALSDLRRIPFAFETEGSRIVFYNPPAEEETEQSVQLIA